MYEPKVSLVIVSRDRPEGLARLLTSLRFQFYKNFEVIVVSNAVDINAENVKHIHFDKPNISAARNLGIEMSAGDLIAFCDDDAVPEPCWLEDLIVPFQDETIGIAGGYVRGRNGIDFQWKAQQVDICGNDMPLIGAPNEPYFIAHAHVGYVPKVQGTNCIFRKETLMALNGFDESFEFYLDETDVCFRASEMGWQTAFVPNAEVQHGFEESDRRTINRVPKSLYAEGKSKAYFCMKHAQQTNMLDVFGRFEKEQRKRLLGLLVDGFLSPKDMAELLKTLTNGFDQGQQITMTDQQRKLKSNYKEFLLFQQNRGQIITGEAFVGSHISKRKMTAEAIYVASKNIPTTMLYWSFTALFHRRFFDMRGFWVQTGGLFGKSDRVQPPFRITRVLTRGLEEISLLKKTRKIEKISFFRFKRVSKVIKVSKNNAKEA